MSSNFGIAFPSRAAAWKLDLPTSSHPAESVKLPDDGSKDAESIIGEDERVLVDHGDLQQGGKYRSIVKIQSRFNDRTTGRAVWMIGTGWLIRPDLLVTAGHVVYDHGYRYGPADQIKCYIGYNGRDSVKTSAVQARYGLNVISTAEWIESPNNRSRDVAFIQGIVLGVVGYPGDKSLRDADGEDEKGAQMYEEFAKTDFDLAASPGNMVEYRVSTFGGQSGAPILRKARGRFTSIGTHCYGGGGQKSNSGNAIGGVYGNNYDAFIALFNIGQQAFGTAANIKSIDCQANGNSSSGTSLNGSLASGLDKGGYASAGSNNNGFTSTGFNNTGFNSSGFGNISSGKDLNGRATSGQNRSSVSLVTKQILPIASSLLGPMGSLAGMAAGHFLGKLTRESMQSESGMAGIPGDDDAIAARALVAEAALEAILSANESPEHGEVIKKMKDIWSTSAPNVDALAPVLTPGLTECALDIASHRLERATTGTTRQGQESTLLPERRDLGISIHEAGGAEAAFVQAMYGPTRPLADAEGGWGWLGSAISTVGKAAVPIVGKVASGALSDSVSPNEEATRILLKRALMADTALQALMTLPREKLERLQVTHNNSGETEGIIDFIKTGVQKLGPTVLNAAKNIANKHVPIAINYGAKKISNHLGLPAEALPNRTIRTIRKQPSFRDSLNAGNIVKVSHVQNTPEAPASVDLSALLLARQEVWKPSNVWRKDWDDNDDGPVIMTWPPLDF
ncbi:Serine protease [Fusarium keratoplasticum]|uniref:Serine protease n=1 Tax=Fusarium keratoplasticum TaxID=1328300 RepID=A0ACC0RG64_9HYPO|nr:Serine protease [Fusarium keratoplasticum]KAI8683849.1 Serine protease [Fusarium keratoplasticum]